MNMQSAHLLRAILRKDFHSFIHKVFNTVNPNTRYQMNWHIDLIAEYLLAAQNRQFKRLIINIPPRDLKSLCVSVAWPAWLLGHNSSVRIMAASYSHMLSIKHSLDCRLVVSSDWFKQTFPNTILSKQHNQKSKFLTTKNGFRFATSVGGSATGEGGDFLIVDDPHNPLHVHSTKLRNKAIEWFEQTFVSRLNDKSNGVIVIVMQRLHEEDLAGYLLSKSNDWELLKIPAQATRNITFCLNNKSYQLKKGELLNKSRDTESRLLALEREVGVQAFAAQYLQEPISQQSSLLTLEDICFYDNLPCKFDYFVQSWDTAIKVSEDSDYSVCTCYGVSNETYYLISMFRQKLTYPELKLKIEETSKKYKSKFILIEDKASGQQIIQDLRFAGWSNVLAIKPKLDKITRFASIVPLFQAGKIQIPKQSAFKHILLEELLTFPNSKHDDIIDSISQCMNFSKKKTTEQLIRIREI